MACLALGNRHYRGDIRRAAWPNLRPNPVGPRLTAWLLDHQTALSIAAALSLSGLLAGTAWVRLLQRLRLAQNQVNSLSQSLGESRVQAAGYRGQLQQVERLHEQLQERDEQLDEQRERLSHVQTQLTDIHARADSAAQHHSAQLALLNDNKHQLKQEFSLLANELFEAKNQKFNEQSQQSMSALLDPFQKQIDQFRQRVDTIHSQDIEGRSQLSSQLTMLREMNNQLNQQAHDLTKALKGDKKLQGNWGELQVERILETSGLYKGREYEREANFKDADGHNRRPDFIIKLPDNKHIIIDSKVSLNAYQQAVAAEDEATRDAAIRDHVAATRAHIRSLSGKNYPGLDGLNAPDFVLMFMPIESAFVAAFEADPQLFNDAFERHIVIVTPTTLLATLRTVANLWALERQNLNAKELFKLAGKIHDKLSVFGGKMDKLGSQLDSAGKTWHEAIGSIRDGRGSMVSYVRRLQELGAPTSRPLPSSLTDRDALDDSPDDEIDAVDEPVKRRD